MNLKTSILEVFERSAVYYDKDEDMFRVHGYKQPNPYLSSLISLFEIKRGLWLSRTDAGSFSVENALYCRFFPAFFAPLFENPKEQVTFEEVKVALGAMLKKKFNVHHVLVEFKRTNRDFHKAVYCPIRAYLVRFNAPQVPVYFEDLPQLEWNNMPHPMEELEAIPTISKKRKLPELEWYQSKHHATEFLFSERHGKILELGNSNFYYNPDEPPNCQTVLSRFYYWHVFRPQKRHHLPLTINPLIQGLEMVLPFLQELEHNNLFFQLQGYD